MANLFKSFSTWIIIGVIAAILPLIFDSSFALTLLSKMGVLIIFTVAYNMLLGQGGMLSFGHAIYFGLAGYASIHIMNGIGCRDASLLSDSSISSNWCSCGIIFWMLSGLCFYSKSWNCFCNDISWLWRDGYCHDFNIRFIL